ncbi:MAG: hypothetical protein R3F59_29385 [Myxococcota bacterium]
MFGPPGGQRWRCPGYQGHPLFVRDLDACMGARRRRRQRRLQHHPGVQHPRRARRVAAARRRAVRVVIVRYRLQGERERSELAVVTVGREGAPGCHVAWVPADAKPSQNQAARDLADTRARAGTCAPR